MTPTSFAVQDSITIKPDDSLFNGKYTFGIGGSAYAQFLLRLGVNGQLVTDNQGNVGILLSISAGGGTPNAGAGGVVMVTTADTIYDLSGVGVSGGASAWIVGADMLAGTARNGDPVVGIQIGLGISAFPIEGHAEVSYGGVISLNWLPNKITQ